MESWINSIVNVHAYPETKQKNFHYNMKNRKLKKKSSTIHFTSNQVLITCKESQQRFTSTCFRGFGHQVNLCQLDPWTQANALNYMEKHKESNPKPSAPHFTSSEAFLDCRGPLRLKLCTSFSSIEHQTNLGNSGLLNNTSDYLTQGQKKVIQGLPRATHWTSNETLLLCQGHWRMELYSFNRF